MHIALERPIAAGRVRIQPTARVDGEVRSLLHGLYGEIFGRLDDDRPLATDPGDDRRTVRNRSFTCSILSKTWR